MIERKLNIRYQEYSSKEEMEPSDQELVDAALKAQKGSYSPYSHFQVGAALRLEDGSIIQGANHPGLAFDTLAVAGADHGILCESPATPCGACRQVMAEYQTKGGRPLKIILIGSRRIYKFARVDDILPLIFDSLKME